MDKRKVLLTAAIAGLFAAGAVVQQAAPVFADETQAPAGEKAACKGGACKGEEAAKPAEGAAAAAGGEAKPAEGKAKKGGKHKGKAKKKKADAPAS